MNNALLGYTGFVGSHLRENLSPSQTEYFNSKNVQDLAGREFDTVYCACVPAVKWKANKNPDEDYEAIDKLKNVLVSVRCRKFVHISTIDVHSPQVMDQVEDNVVPADTTYGKNRYALEVFLREAFGDKLLVIRLPAIFGVGLKKNYLYDLMNNNQVETINLNSSFQWYSLSWLWEDLNLALEEERSVVNLYTETIETSEIVRTFFPEVEYSNPSPKFGERVFYSQSSKYGGGKSTAEVLKAMADFISLEATKKKESNNLAVSNMAWKTEHDEHAAFLMQRYGIKNLEILPTKFASWEEVFQNNLEKQLEVFRRQGISVYSVQSVFHGVDGNFGDRNIEEHLEKVVRFCENVGAEVMVMGSPSMRGKNCDRGKLADLLDKVQARTTKVRICLEPNSAVYRCYVGKTLDECLEVRKDRKFYVNYDAGNAYMEKDRLPEQKDRVGHVQISNALLNPMKKSDYDRILRSGVCGAIGELFEKGEKGLKVSLEVSMFDNIKLLGEQIRRFSQFGRTYLV